MSAFPSGLVGSGVRAAFSRSAIPTNEGVRKHACFARNEQNTWLHLVGRRTMYSMEDCHSGQLPLFLDISSSSNLVRSC